MCYGRSKRAAITLRAVIALAHRSSDLGTGMPALSMAARSSVCSSSGTATCRRQRQRSQRVSKAPPSVVPRAWQTGYRDCDIDIITLRCVPHMFTRHTLAFAVLRLCTPGTRGSLESSFSRTLTSMTMDRHSASAGSAAVGGMRSTAACRRLRTSALAGASRASSKEPNGTVTDAGSAMESGSLPRSPGVMGAFGQARVRV